MKTLSLACALALGLSLTALAPVQAEEHPSTTMQQATTQLAPQLHVAMRALWHGHVDGTRAYAMAVRAGDTAAANAAADATVENAKQIAAAVAGVYGEDAGKGIMDLLAGHWGGVKAMTDAEKAGDKAAGTKAFTDLTANADAIAKFLSGANPNLTEAGVRGLLVMHIADHQAQIHQIMTGDFAAEAKTWVHMQAHMDTLGDALADAIAKQFPDKVS